MSDIDIDNSKTNISHQSSSSNSATGGGIIINTKHENDLLSYHRGLRSIRNLSSDDGLSSDNINTQYVAAPAPAAAAAAAANNGNNGNYDDENNDIDNNTLYYAIIYDVLGILFLIWFCWIVISLIWRCCNRLKERATITGISRREGYEEVLNVDGENGGYEPTSYSNLKKIDENGNIIPQLQTRESNKRYTFDNDNSNSNNNNNTNNEDDDDDDDEYTAISGLTFSFRTKDLMTLADSDDQPSHMNTASASASASASALVIIQKQKYGYFSIIISFVQIIIMIIMIVIEYNKDNKSSSSSSSSSSWSSFISGNGGYGFASIHDNPMIGPSMIPTNNELIIEWVGISKETILDSIFNQGEWYKLLTPILFHSGFIHLIINILIQLQIGYQFECEWGSCIWIIIYILGAVGSTLLSLKLLPNAEFISIGSSGAIMGLFGGKIAEVICRCCETAITDQDYIGHEIRQKQRCTVLMYISVIMLLSFTNNICPYVDGAQHLGGLIFGFCIGMIIFSTSGSIQKEFCTKLCCLLVGISLFAVCILFIT